MNGRRKFRRPLVVCRPPPRNQCTPTGGGQHKTDRRQRIGLGISALFELGVMSIKGAPAAIDRKKKIEYNLL